MSRDERQAERLSGAKMMHPQPRIASPGAVLGWLGRPLIAAVPWTHRARHYVIFVLLIAFSSPFLHAYLDVALSPGEMMVHTTIVVAAVAAAILLVEVLLSAAAGPARRKRPISTGGFLLRATSAYVVSSMAVGPMHAVSPYTHAIMRAHAEATRTSVFWQLLPVALLIVYVVYQIMRGDYLAREVAALQRINDELRRTPLRRQGEGRDGDAQADAGDAENAPITVPLNGVDVPLRAEAIVRIEADQNYCHIVVGRADLPAKSHLVRMTLKQALGVLPPGVFLQTHRSHVVNLSHVIELRRGSHRREVRVSNGEWVPVSRTRFPAVQAALRDHLSAGSSA